MELKLIGALLFGILALGCMRDDNVIPLEVVQRVTSPDGALDAVLVHDLNGGVTVPEKGRCYVVKRGATPDKDADEDSEFLRFVYSPGFDPRNVAMKWQASDKLLVSSKYLWVMQFSNHAFLKNSAVVGIKLSIERFGDTAPSPISKTPER
jgi:hypothetical protein